MAARFVIPLFAALCAFFVCMTAVSPAQAQSVRLEIRLRDGAGAPVAGESVTLQRLPEEADVQPACVTGAAGSCVWQVRRGLYQLLFARPLDDVSALALAEGGLRGFGLTVGEADVTYHFTLQADGRIYFDAAPEAAIPAAIIPSFDSLQGGAAPTPAITFTDAAPTAMIELAPVVETAVPSAAPDFAGETAVTGPSSWRILLALGLGLALGGGLHLYSRRQPNRLTKRPNDQETNHA